MSVYILGGSVDAYQDIFLVWNLYNFSIHNIEKFMIDYKVKHRLFFVFHVASQRVKINHKNCHTYALGKNPRYRRDISNTIYMSLYYSDELKRIGEVLRERVYGCCTASFCDTRSAYPYYVSVVDTKPRKTKNLVVAHKLPTGQYVVVRRNNCTHSGLCSPIDWSNLQEYILPFEESNKLVEPTTEGTV